MGVNAYFDILGEKWSSAVVLLKKDTITSDQLNKALNTGDYETYPAYFVKDKNHSRDYGKSIVDEQIKSVVKRLIPTLDYLINDIYNQLDVLSQLINMNEKISYASESERQINENDELLNQIIEEFKRLEMIKNKYENIKKEIEETTTTKNNKLKLDDTNDKVKKPISNS
jgi:cell fate (sporulation/competence/biofilm development) regulator YmcA (YheA/YmcA/DUF963 family)